MYLNGQISLELVPQGTLAERIRAHAAGIPAFFTPTGANTAVETGMIPQRYNPGGLSAGVATPGIKKESREIDGRRYVLETAIPGDFALIRAWKVDEAGNCVFRCANFPVCSCARLRSVDMHRRISALRWQRMPRSPSSRFAPFRCQFVPIHISLGGEHSSHWFNISQRYPRPWHLYRPYCSRHHREEDRICHTGF